MVKWKWKKSVVGQSRHKNVMGTIRYPTIPGGALDISTMEGCIFRWKCQGQMFCGRYPVTEHPSSHHLFKLGESPVTVNWSKFSSDPLIIYTQFQALYSILWNEPHELELVRPKRIPHATREKSRDRARCETFRHSAQCWGERRHSSYHNVCIPSNFMLSQLLRSFKQVYWA